MPRIQFLIRTTCVYKELIGKTWFVRFEGSQERLGLDDKEPDFGPGDRCEIIIRKEELYAQPVEPSVE